MSDLSYQLILSLSVLPMLYFCWKADKTKNHGNAKKIMQKKIKP